MVAITQFLYSMESGFNYLHIAKCSGDICNKLGANSPFAVRAEGFCDSVGIQWVTGRMPSPSTQVQMELASSSHLPAPNHGCF